MPVGSELPAYWGGDVTTKGRILYMKKMSGSEFFDVPVRLPGFAVGAPEFDERAEIKVSRFEYYQGVIREFVRTIAKKFTTGYNFEIMLPEASPWSPIDLVANSRKLERRDLFAVQESVEDTKFKHFYRYLEGVFDEIKSTSVIIATTEDGEPLKRSTMYHSEAQKLYWQIGLTEQKTDSTADPLYAVGFVIRNSDDLDDWHQNGVFGGGDGTAVPVLDVTANRFATSSDVSNTLAAGSIITDCYIDGDLVIYTYSDEPYSAAASATTGGILVSTDGGATVTALTAPVAALYAVTYGNGYYVAVGEDGAVWRSRDAFNWTAMTNAVAAAGDQYQDIAFDPAFNLFYIAGHDASTSLAVMIDGDNVIEITASVNAGANNLYRVAVLEKDHVIFVGASGIIRENAKASENGTYRTVTISGVSSTLLGVTGDKARTFIGGGVNVYERSFLTEGLFRAVTKNTGTTITGDVTRLEMGDSEWGVNYLVGVTDESEVFVAKPYSPDA